MAQYQITTGGIELVSHATKVLSEAFEDDPTMAYTLPTMSREQRVAFLPRYFESLLTSAATNNASIDGIADWQSCGILMPPGCHYDGAWSMLQAGFFPVLWAAGLEGCRVRLQALPPHLA